MELSQMRYFLTAAKTQHITKAAEQLHIAQPALTKAIHNLERELGVSLFTKKGRNVILTQYGVLLRDKLQPIQDALDALPREFESAALTENRTVRLAVLAASSFVTDAIIAYRKVCPEAIFHVLQSPLNEQYDIEITTIPHVTQKTELVDSCCVRTEEIFLAVPNTGKYDKLESIALKDMKEEGFISLSGAKQLRTICDGFCKSVGFTPNIVFDSDSPSAVKNMIAANLGVGFWPEFTWGEVLNPNVRLLPIIQPSCKRDLVFRRVDCDNSKAYVTDFFEFLCSYHHFL